MLPTKHQFATIDEDQVFSTLSAAQVRSAGKLGDRPLIVLTAPRQDDIPPEIPRKDVEAEEDLWAHQLQPELLVSRPMANRSLSTAATKCQPNIRRPSSRRFVRYGSQLVFTALQRIRRHLELKLSSLCA